MMWGSISVGNRPQVTGFSTEKNGVAVSLGDDREERAKILCEKFDWDKQVLKGGWVPGTLRER
jgi:hypothetical protein